ncbi:LacI family DNA-binding transcriptional regulator [Listeria costaricensis]|uniref:LacI family DNA-binding transcriptional regulator n=1 Tax=Listeria costaricensis TaxID=2026604 RepID=UPI000C0682E8|nr:LacI family DNA-binding transcriptional regulator [Listeria costaricensis]
MPNIREIAKLAGVSVTTVSRVLNDHPYVAAEKRARVQEVIKELDYIPNRSATNLARGKTETVGVILPYNDHPWFDKVTSGVLEAAFKQRYSVTLFPTNYDPETEEKYLMMLKTKQVDGLIIVSRANPLEIIEPYAAYGPIVVSEYTELEGLSCAYLDREEAYRAGFQYLYNEGYRRVAFTAGRDAGISPSTSAKIKAYQAVFGEEPRDNLLLDCYSVRDGYDAADYFFAETSFRPDAIYATGDEAGAGIMQYAAEHGLKVPQDVAVLGQENLPIGVVLGLSTLDQHLKKLGRTAFQIFKSGKVQKKRIDHSLIIRTTV